MAMDEHQKHRVIDWLRTKVGPITCSVCSSPDYKIDSELTSLPVWLSEPEPHVTFVDSVVVVILICADCANIRLFSASRMGIIPT